MKSCIIQRKATGFADRRQGLPTKFCPGGVTAGSTWLGKARKNCVFKYRQAKSVNSQEVLSFMQMNSLVPYRQLFTAHSF